MKKYSLKINGNPYEVKIEDINESSTMARVTVNGTKYDVEIEGGKASVVKKPQVAAVPQAATSISVTPQRRCYNRREECCNKAVSGRR